MNQHDLCCNNPSTLISMPFNRCHYWEKGFITFLRVCPFLGVSITRVDYRRIESRDSELTVRIVVFPLVSSTTMRTTCLDHRLDITQKKRQFINAELQSQIQNEIFLKR